MDELDRHGVKRDRLARLIRVLQVVQAAGDEGVRPEEIARRVGMSRRNVYRDLHALEDEVEIPLWNEGGRWGVASETFLPPLKLTRSEAMAVVLSARLMVRYADKYDPDLAAAFQKMEEGLPPALREHVDRTLEVLARRPLDATFSRHVHLLTRAWAERRVVTLSYAPVYGPAGPRTARVRPYLIEPSLQTHALYLMGWDETRNAMRTFKIERITELALTPDTFEAPEAGTLEAAQTRAWDIIADQPEAEVVLHFAAPVAARVREATWHPTQEVEPTEDGGLLWRARVSGTLEIRLWVLSWGADVEVLEPAELREDIAATVRQAAARYEVAR
jgi:proteasome accessory factor B